MNELKARKTANDKLRRLLYLKISAYEHKLKKDIDPDSPAWAETYDKLQALELEMDAAFMESLKIRDEIREAVDV